MKLSKQTALFAWKLTIVHNDRIETNENNHLCLFNDCRGTMECKALSYNPDFSTKWQMHHEKLLYNWLLIELRSNQLWHTCELRCSSKVFYWKTVYSDFPWIRRQSNQSRWALFLLKLVTKQRLFGKILNENDKKYIYFNI